MSIYLHENIYITKVSSKKLRVFEAFAGIGAQRRALINIDGNFEIVGMAEWFVPAIISYQAMHNSFNSKNFDFKVSRKEMEDFLESKVLSMDSKIPVKKGYWRKKHLDFLRIVYKAVKMSCDENNIFDVTTLYKRKLSGIDLLTYSFPCQDLSQQGKQKGMSKDKNTRSGLLWEIEKALNETPKSELPKYLLMENVMALTTKKNAYELSLWKKRLEELGYENDLQILNAADFGSAQARRRAFMLSTLNNKIELPKGNKKPRPIKNILDKSPSQEDFMPALYKYDISPMRVTSSNIKKGKLINYTTFNSEAYIYDINHTGPTLTASGANSRIKVKFEDKIKKINAREAFRYMGFTDKDYEKVKSLNFLSEEKMIYTCGNSISVEVLEKIMERILENERM